MSLFFAHVWIPPLTSEDLELEGPFDDIKAPPELATVFTTFYPRLHCVSECTLATRRNFIDGPQARALDLSHHFGSRLSKARRCLAVACTSNCCIFSPFWTIQTSI